MITIAGGDASLALSTQYDVERFVSALPEPVKAMCETIDVVVFTIDALAVLYTPSVDADTAHSVIVLGPGWPMAPESDQRLILYTEVARAFIGRTVDDVADGDGSVDQVAEKLALEWLGLGNNRQEAA